MEKEKWILIADDHESIQDILKKYLEKEGYRTIRAFDGKEALEKFYSYGPTLVLLDVMMPEKDGFEVCREIRKSSTVPIIMITAKTEDHDKIMGLDTGADDYVVKPFSPSEVMARVRAILRRMEFSEDNGTQILRKSNLMVNLKDYIATIDGEELSLTKKEMEILWLLGSNPGRVYSREILLDKIWGLEYLGDARTVDTHIKRLRGKLDQVSHDQWEIKTIWGVGYKFEWIGGGQNET